MNSDVYVQQANYGEPARLANIIAGFIVSCGLDAKLNPNTKVVIKPNLLSKNIPEKAVTTHPDVLHGTILALQHFGVKHITVADSPGGLHTAAIMRGIYKVCGIQAVCDATGATTNLHNESAEVPAPKSRLVKKFNLLRPVAEADVIINLPKLKTHMMTGMSGAVKNLFGTVPGLEKAEFHMHFPEKQQFGVMLVDLCETLHADLHIVDGILSMEGDGPGSGTPRQTGLLIAGCSPYTVDLAICRFIGMDPMTIPFLQAAHSRGLCPERIAPEQLHGEQAALEPFKDFILPASYEGSINFVDKLPKFLRPVGNRVAKFAAPKPVIRKKRCIGCGKCAEICPHHTIAMQGGRAVIDYGPCIKCFCCHEVCPVKAIDVRRLGLFTI